MKNIYKNYLENLELYLQNDDLQNLDEFLENIYTSLVPENDLEEISEILQEATLYLEFQETEYKEMALELIKQFKN